ncbi:MAG: SDR family oxidoreductase [Janthinobacterium lividum]
MQLDNKVAVVTGASAGIGAAIATELARAGARLVLTGRREDRLQEVARSIGTDCVILAADIADPSTPERLLQLAQDRFGQSDIVINNAGVLTVGPLETIDLDELSQMIRINFEAVVRSSYVFARVFKAQKSGAIINLSSIGAYLTASMGGVYGGLKQALDTFTQALRIELAGTGVKVGSIAPGTTQTEIFRDMRARGEKGWDEYIATPLQGEDIAAAVRFMLEQPDRATVARLLLVSSDDAH